MTQLNVNKFQHTNGTDALVFATPRVEPTRLVLPNVDNTTLPPVSETITGETYFNTTDKKLYTSTGTGYIVKSGFSQPSGTFSYGFGSTTSSGSTSASPINVWYRRNIFQTVYTVSDLTDNGAEAGAIFRNLKWDVTGAVNPSNSVMGFTLRLFHTTTSSGDSLASPISGESKVTVYADTANGDGTGTAFTLVETTGIKTITFGGGNASGVSSSFEWDGINNICIESCTQQNEGTYNSSGQLRIFSVSNGSRYFWTDSQGNSCLDDPNFSEGFKPSVQMDFF